MFEWFSGSSQGNPGLEKMRAEFGQMLDAGRHIFNSAANAFLGGTDPEVIRQDLFSTDKRINHAEQQIRREIVVHASVHGATVFPACLILMSVVKDAERVGDYAKNIFDLAALSTKRPIGEYKDDLVRLKDQISHIMADCREAFDIQDKQSARQLIADTQRIEDHCDNQVAKLVKAGTEVDLAVSYALAYRYFKRVTSHVFNVATSVVQSVDKIDFVSKDESRSAAANHVRRSH
jgi:phosphate transport system protein